MNAYERAVVYRAIEEIAAANEKLSQQMRELQEIVDKYKEQVAA